MDKPKPIRYITTEGGRWHEWSRDFKPKIAAIQFEDGTIFDIRAGWRVKPVWTVTFTAQQTSWDEDVVADTLEDAVTAAKYCCTQVEGRRMVRIERKDVLG